MKPDFEAVFMEFSEAVAVCRETAATLGGPGGV
jgi:hypothetical protein